MRSRAPLSVLEQLLMVLVFALAAAICLRGFVWADSTSRRNQNRDLALVQAQSAAAVVQYNRGDLTRAARSMGGQAQPGQWTIHYDEQWGQTDEGGAFVLQVTPEVTEQSGLLGSARVKVTGGGETLVQLEVSWQEVAAQGE